MSKRAWLAAVLPALWAAGHLALAQELDTEPAKSPPPAMPSKPFQATVSKTLYLPPAMYGHWNVRTYLVQTNYDEFFKPVITDTWILSREGDEVIISNPATGASASVMVDETTGNRATFHRTIPAGRKKTYTEIPTISVNGDTMQGEVLNLIEYRENGQVKKTLFGRYRLEATRISGGRIQFRPEAGQGPELEIEDIAPAP